LLRCSVKFIAGSACLGDGWASGGVVMMSLPPDGYLVAQQLELLNLMLFCYFVCKGVAYAGAVFGRRDPPKKSIRPNLAPSSES